MLTLYEIGNPLNLLYIMAFLDPGVQLLIEIVIGSGIALFLLWKLKKRTDEKDLKTRRE